MKTVLESERLTGWPLFLSWIAIYSASWGLAYTIYFLANRVLIA